MEFEIQSQETAPLNSRPHMQEIAGKLGFVPNIIGIMAASPAVIEAYNSLSRAFEKTTLDNVQQQLVMLAAAYENECGYCMAAHSTMAKQTGDIPESWIEALRNGQSLPEEKPEALVQFVREVTQTRGQPEEATTDRFLKAGFNQTQLLEVLVGVTLKTLTNYTNHIAETPLDKPLQKEAWEPGKTKAA